MRRALEGGQAEPSNAFPVASQGYSMTSGRREWSSPSLSVLCGHPHHCSATPHTALTLPTLLERTGTGTSPWPPLYLVQAPVDDPLEPVC
jgi:hypothetical protein